MGALLRTLCLICLLYITFSSRVSDQRTKFQRLVQKLRDNADTPSAPTIVGDAPHPDTGAPLDPNKKWIQPKVLGEEEKSDEEKAMTPLIIPLKTNPNLPIPEAKTFTPHYVEDINKLEDLGEEGLPVEQQQQQQAKQQQQQQQVQQEHSQQQAAGLEGDPASVPEGGQASVAAQEEKK